MFKSKVDDKEYDFCRAVPPVPVLFEEKTVRALYPLAPARRCGLYQKLRFWMRTE
jgi:hypothetical protein